jgi:hypothetical protein
MGPPSTPTSLISIDERSPRPIARRDPAAAYGLKPGTVWRVWTSEGKWLPNTERGREILKWCVLVGVVVFLVLIVVVGVQAR